MSAAWPLWHQKPFASPPAHFSIEMRQQIATDSPTLWTVHRRGVASPGHTGVRRGVQPASG